MKEVIHTDLAPKAVGPYSQAIMTENMMEMPTMNRLKNRVTMPPTVVPRLRRALMRLSLRK